MFLALSPKALLGLIQGFVLAAGFESWTYRQWRFQWAGLGHHFTKIQITQFSFKIKHWVLNPGIFTQVSSAYRVERVRLHGLED